MNWPRSRRTAQRSDAQRLLDRDAEESAAAGPAACRDAPSGPSPAEGIMRKINLIKAQFEMAAETTLVAAIRVANAELGLPGEGTKVQQVGEIMRLLELE